MQGVVFVVLMVTEKRFLNAKVLQKFAAVSGVFTKN
jgi:hypothetical protein